jgi:hypothetical protein
MNKVLFVNHKKQKCGVYQFGKLTYEAIYNSNKFEYKYTEVECLNEFLSSYDNYNPNIIIFNYHDQTQPWLTEGVLSNLPNSIKKIAIGGHDCFANFDSIDIQIIPDPTVIETNKIKKVDRLILDFQPSENILTNSVGSFGFGFFGKDWMKIINIVNNSPETELLRLHIPYSDFADPNGYNATYIAAACRQHLDHRISLSISHEFMSIPDLLLWLSSHSINIFPYEEMKGRGISSTIDFALSCRRPIGISKSDMFRHIYHKSEILLDINSLQSIKDQGTTPLQDFYKWTADNLKNQYETILLSI